MLDVMSEEIPSDFCPDLNELESKMGRKTPDSLLVWMKDAVGCKEGWASSNASDRGEHDWGGLSVKINYLKREMRCLRCADVKILQQLIAVNEGIEAMRWLIEERGILTSQCNSSSSSLSSLAAIEEQLPSMFPCSIVPDEKPAYESPSQPVTSDPRPASPIESIKVESYSQAPLTTANSLVRSDGPKSQTLELGSARLHIRSGAETIWRILARSIRRGGTTTVSQDVGEKDVAHRTQSLTVFKSDEVKKEKPLAGGEKELQGYDAQWSWVDSKDDVTFL